MKQMSSDQYIPGSWGGTYYGDGAPNILPMAEGENDTRGSLAPPKSWPTPSSFGPAQNYVVHYANRGRQLRGQIADRYNEMRQRVKVRDPKPQTGIRVRATSRRCRRSATRTTSRSPSLVCRARTLVCQLLGTGGSSAGSTVSASTTWAPTMTAPNDVST